MVKENKALRVLRRLSKESPNIDPFYLAKRHLFGDVFSDKYLPPEYNKAVRQLSMEKVKKDGWNNI